MFIRALAVTTTSVSLALVTVMGFGVTSALADSVPRVNAISPTSGPTTGGTSVIISGTGFATGDTVSFGTAPSSSVTVASSISITAVAPAGTAGTVSVVVTDTNGSGMGTVNFTYAAAPTMTGVTPNNGSTTGGTSVTINGTNFGSDSSVAIGGATATGVVVVDSTQITAVTPPGTTGSQDVTVTDTGGSATLAGGFIYGAPTVTSITPIFGPSSGGTSVTINGTNFGSDSSVTIGGATATGVVVVDPTQITAVTSAGVAGTAAVVVTDTAGAGTGTNIFTYGTAPSITGVTITGTPSLLQVLNASASGVTGDPVPLASYQWLSDGIPISGATSSTYIVSGADVGSSLAVTITESNGVGAAASATSNPVAVPLLSSALEITTTSSSSTHGSPVAFTAVVSPSTATGTVTFKSGSTVFGSCTLSSGTCAVVTSSLAVGTDAMSATYTGDSLDSASTSATFAYTVTRIVSSVSLLAIPARTSALHSSVRFKADVSPSTARGTVTFKNGSTILGSCRLSSGRCAFTTTSLPGGTDTIRASYLGGLGFARSTSSAMSYTVAAVASAISSPHLATTATQLLALPARTSAFTSSVRFKADVSPSTATGTVAFKSGSTVFGSCTLSSGTCAVVTSSLAVGTDAMSATYTGDSLDSASTSATLTYTVTRIVTSVSLLAIPARTSAFTSSVRFKADVSPSTARGTVTFKNGSTVLGSCRLSSGRCAFTTTSLPGGTDTIRASYQPNAQDSSKYTSATSNPQVELVLVSIPVATSATQRLTRPALGNQVLSGFAPSSAVAIQAVGSRTVSSFELSSGLINDSSLSLAISSSASQQGAGFAQVTSVAAVSNARARNFAGIQGVAAATVNRYLSDSSLQPPRMVNSYLGTPGHKWVEITVEVSSYVPGTIAFLAVTTRPLMFADAVIGKDGMAVIRGVFPVDLLGMGAHHIRVVGERVLDTVLANSRGQVMFPAFAITAIHQFDAKTMATVSIDGMSANNTPLTLVRVVALGASISWWTLLFPAVLLLAALLAVVLGWVRRRRNRVLVNVVVFGGSIVPIVTGWHEGVFALANAGFDIGFGAIVLVQLLPNLRNERVVRERSQFFGYRFERRSDRLKGRNVYEEDEMGSAYSPYQRGSQWRRRIERRIGARPTRPIGVSADQFEADRSGRERTRPSASKRSHGQEELSEKLAGRPNLILFLERVGQALARASGDDSKIAVLYFNLDGFRVFNDAKGKEYGDVLLQVVAERLRATIGDDDVLAHLAADEYAILCNDVADEADAHSRAEQILKAFKRPFVLADGEVMASASIGIALGDQYASPSALVEDAEIALHTAKKVGRGGVRIYDVGIRKRAEYRFTLDGALHHALARNELFLAYQPIASLRTRRYVGVEALLRWRHPELGVIGPEEFIPVAEENGLIVPIGTWVLERACEQLRLWRDASPEASGWLMSVNAAALQLRALDFPDVIERSLEHSGLMSSDLRIELTESALIESGVATDVLRRLRELGVRISIDDFGIKYSSLSYLTRLPIDELKIDESFIGGLVGDESMQAIVAAILTIGRSLGLTVTAEGVETEAQLIELLMLGCDSVQGFLFEKPLPPDECFTALMGTPRPPLGRKL